MMHLRGKNSTADDNQSLWKTMGTALKTLGLFGFWAADNYQLFDIDWLSRQYESQRSTLGAKKSSTRVGRTGQSKLLREQWQDYMSTIEHTASINDVSLRLPLALKCWRMLAPLNCAPRSAPGGTGSQSCGC
jgi:hypothetical protein